MTIANVSSVVGAVSTLSSAAAATSKPQTSTPTASLDKAFARVFQSGGLTADLDDDWCPTKPHPWPHGPLGGLNINSFSTQIR